ncbi:hypothetical protein HUG10_05855 [Halorarum halophilum]|uniref:CHAT domain-containing protein n=1 Tax=Halorarum halophilum TaxID=2743090 RepID=A0A7D5KD20_9EURY|nr:hypothetical protein [Halobaculum halophilum]QLG27097.1 hypothetical protein HUG10_05855 [Halobaculum halophilum]
MSEPRERPVEPLTLVSVDGPADYEIADHIEEVRMPLRVDDVTGCPSRIDSDGSYPTPVDARWRITAGSITPLCTADVYVRTPDNAVVATATADSTATVPPGRHVLELSTAPVKTYLSLEGPALVRYDGRYPTVSFDGGADRIEIGARSRHETPAGTVTVTEDPADVAAGLSTFGSALATTSPERSFPTLRGHPPLLELGDDFEVPPLVERVDTGVELAVPFEYGPLFSAAPAAYYLGASIHESDRPSLEAGGRSYRLPTEHEDLAAELGRLLRHCFTLDCATRACSAGLYDVDLQVHESLTARLDPPWSEWYEMDLADRTAAYLDVPLAATEGEIGWPQTTDVKPVAENASILPFLAADLSTVRSPPPTPTVPNGGGSTPLDEFVRNERSTAFTRGAERAGSGDAAPPDTFRSPTQNVTEEDEAVVSPRPAESTSLAWVGPGYPMRAAKPTVAAYRRRLDRTPSADLTIDVTVVCNDKRMTEEADDVYGFRDHVVFEVTQKDGLTVEELRELLRGEHDFLHYIGHVDQRGVECTDGFLDLRSQSDTGVDAFLLNACTSYRQGMALVEAGALGGVVSLTELPNSLATRVGRDLARLFDAGFPLDAALDVVGRGPFAGSSYTIVGDPRVQLCQCASGTPIVVDAISEPEDDAIEFDVWRYPTSAFEIGSMSGVVFADSQRQHVGSGQCGQLRVTKTDLENMLSFGSFPLSAAGRIYWSTELTATELFDAMDPQSQSPDRR